MAKNIINNNDSGLVVRNNLNNNFTELYDNMITTASELPFVAVNEIISTDVQSAIAEVNEDTNNKLTNLEVNGGYF